MELVISPECVPELLRMYNISRWKEISIIFANRVESVSEFYFSYSSILYVYYISRKKQFWRKNNVESALSKSKAFKKLEEAFKKHPPLWHFSATFMKRRKETVNKDEREERREGGEGTGRGEWGRFGIQNYKDTPCKNSLWKIVWSLWPLWRYLWTVDLFTRVNIIQFV